MCEFEFILFEYYCHWILEAFDFTFDLAVCAPFFALNAESFCA